MENLLEHHKKLPFCTNRPNYRDGRKLRAVKVYTISQESRYLLIIGIPKLPSSIDDLQIKLSVYGDIIEQKIVTDYPCEAFTMALLVKYERIISARIAKRYIDDYNYMGGILHVCYAPEYESISDTLEKLMYREYAVNKRIKQLKDSKSTIKDFQSISDTNIFSKSKSKKALKATCLTKMDSITETNIQLINLQDTNSKMLYNTFDFNKSNNQLLNNEQSVTKATLNNYTLPNMDTNLYSKNINYNYNLTKLNSLNNMMQGQFQSINTSIPKPFPNQLTSNLNFHTPAVDQLNSIALPSYIFTTPPPNLCSINSNDIYFKGNYISADPARLGGPVNLNKLKNFIFSDNNDLRKIVNDKTDSFINKIPIKKKSLNDDNSNLADKVNFNCDVNDNESFANIQNLKGNSINFNSNVFNKDILIFEPPNKGSPLQLVPRQIANSKRQISNKNKILSTPFVKDCTQSVFRENNNKSLLSINKSNIEYLDKHNNEFLQVPALLDINSPYSKDTIISNVDSNKIINRNSCEINYINDNVKSNTNNKLDDKLLIANEELLSHKSLDRKRYDNTNLSNKDIYEDKDYCYSDKFIESSYERTINQIRKKLKRFENI